MKIFLDMDGVLMDFDRALHDNGLFVWSQRPGNRIYHHLPPEHWTEEEAEHDRDISKLMGTVEFWDSIQPMADAHLLWDYCRPFMADVLTARPRNEEAAARVSQAKTRSIWKFFDGAYDPRHIHICLRSEKAKFALDDNYSPMTERNILVDDLPGNCEEWARAGGIAILHTDAVTTIKKLSELYHD